MVLGHVKWFVVENGLQSVEPFTFAEPMVQIGLGILAVALIAAFLVDRYSWDWPKKWTEWAERNQDDLLHVAQGLAGWALLLVAFQGSVLAPHYDAYNGFTQGLRGLEGLIGLMLIANEGVWIAAGLLMVLYGGTAFAFGAAEVVEYLNWVGLAVFFFVLRAPAREKLTRYRAHALPILRWTTGLALIVLAFTEKLSDPAESLGLLQQFDMNFMNAAGFEYGDRAFVYSVGLAELFFGLVYLTGWITRPNTVAFGVFLLVSNLWFYWNGHSVEGNIEFNGHLAVFAAAFLLLMFEKPAKDR